MSWDQLRGHQELVTQFRTALQRQRLSSTFLFIGPPGIGKRQFALNLAKSLLCQRTTEPQFDFCGLCPSCVQVDAGSHPDLIQIRKPEDKAILPIDLFIGDREHRMRAGLCHDISLKPYSGSRKVAIIDDADYFNQESANSLLKTLEEPPPGSVMIMIGTSEQKQLPTIRSRSQVIRFQPLSEADVRELLEQRGIAAGEEAAEAARLSGGSLSQAELLCGEESREFRRELLTALSDSRCDTVALTKLIADFAEAAGTDAAPKRARMRQAAALAARFYRELLLSCCGAVADGDSQDPAVAAAAKWWPGQEAAMRCLDQCVEAEAEVNANANLANWCEHLVDVLTRTPAGT